LKITVPPALGKPCGGYLV